MIGGSPSYSALCLDMCFGMISQTFSQNPRKVTQMSSQILWVMLALILIVGYQNQGEWRESQSNVSPADRMSGGGW